jgi:peptide/nickel transport system substrate-binding protein
MTLPKVSLRAATARSVLGVALLGASVLALAQKAETPIPGGKVAMALGSDPTSVNPDLSSNYQNQLVGCIIYQGLVQVTKDSKILPLLARSWSISPDGLTYSFDLVKANWHDGKPFTSEDVVYTLTNVSAKLGPIFNSAGQQIESVTAPAPDKVVVKLKQPFGPFLMSLACAQNGAILPAHVFKGTDPLTNPASLDKPVGTGPFKLVEWNRGSYIRLEKNTDYWEKGKPYLDQVVAKIIPQASSRLQALRAGEVDFIGGYNVPPTDHVVIKSTKGLKLENSGFAPGAKSLFLNTTHKPLDDKRVRQALMLATDRDFLYRAVWFGTGGLGVQPFTTKLGWSAHPTIDYRKLYPKDVARANKLLDEAGLKKDASGKRFTLAFVYRAEDADVAQVAEALKSMWRAIGVEVKGEVSEGTSYPDRIYSKANFDLTMVGYTSFGDPALGISRTFVTGSIGKPFGNASRYSNPEVDKLFEQGAQTTAQAERAVFYRKAAEILAQDLPTLTFHEYQHDDAASARLKGLWGGQGYGWWNNAWIAR